MGFSQSDITRDACMLTGRFRRKGYDWWWHSFTGISRETGEAKSFFIEFFLCNPDRGGRKPILGQLPANKEVGRYPSYLCVKAGTWGKDAAQLHRFFGWNDVALKKQAPFAVAAEDCYLSETATKGRITVTPREAIEHPEYMCEPGKMSWNLKIKKQIPFNVGYGAGKLFRMLKAFEMYWHAEGMKTAYSGTVTWNGEIYDVHPENCYGYADKNWGSDFTSPWVWLSSCNMTSRLTGKKLTNSVFDIGGGTPRIFGIPLKHKLLGAVYYEGKEYEFNFSKFWTFPRTRFESIDTGDTLIWHVKQDSCNARIVLEVKCKKEDMLLINYEAPDGTKRYEKLWNGGTGTGRLKLYKKEGIYLTLVDDISVRNVGCEFGVFEDDRDI